MSQTDPGQKLRDRSSQTSGTSYPGMLRLTPNWRLIKYLFNPLLSANRIFETGDNIVTVSGVFLAVIVITLVFFGIRKLYI